VGRKHYTVSGRNPLILIKKLNPGIFTDLTAHWQPKPPDTFVYFPLRRFIWGIISVFVFLENSLMNGAQ